MVTILGLNIWNYNEPWARRRELIARTVRRLNPDLVALQEVRHDTTYGEDPHHQASQILSRLTGYEIVWQPAMYYSGNNAEHGGKQWEGLAILSRLPITDRRHVWLSRDPEDPRDHHQRIVLAARVMSPAGPFWLFTTHLSLSDRARRRTIVEAYRFVRHVAGEEPFAITGDFNALPEDAPIRFLVGAETLEGTSGEWADAWTTLYPGQPGYTYSAWEPVKRIDYLFVPQADMARSMTIVGGEIDSAEGVYPSDHSGVYAELGW